VDHEYLLSYGNAGDFGRFRPVRPLQCHRGDRAVVRTHRGEEIGVVLCEATPGHAHFLPNTTLGQIVRLTTAEDESTAQSRLERSQQIFADSRRLASELALPFEVLDVEVLLDGKHAVVHHLRWQECDERPFVSALSTKYELFITLTGAAPVADVEEPGEEEHGCGRPDCGKGEGGCSSCGSGGGCSTCGSAESKALEAHFRELRTKMEEQRTPLL
jgi:hypothetical protein